MQLITTHADGGYVAEATGTALTDADLAELVRQGTSFKVVEPAAERDITAQVLAEVFVTEDLATKQAVVKRLVLTPFGNEGVDLRHLAKHVVLAAIGGAETVIEGFERLVQKGEAAERAYATTLKAGLSRLERGSDGRSASPGAPETGAEAAAMPAMPTDSVKASNGKGTERPSKKAKSA